MAWLVTNPVVHLKWMWMALLAGLLASAPAHAWRIEAHEVTLNNTFNSATFTPVTFLQPFDTVPVVVALASSQGGDPSDLRIRNVTTTGFEIAQVEPQGRDGPHVPMTIPYIAAEIGQQTFPDGTRVMVGTVATSAVQAFGTAGSFQPVTFPVAFDGTPAVVASIQTMNTEAGNPPGGISQPWYTTVVENVSLASFDVALERSQTTLGTPGTETIGYIAVEAGTSGTFLDISGTSTNWAAARTGATILGWSDGCSTVPYSGTAFANPRVVATKNSRTNADGGWLRSCTIGGTTIQLRVDEDTAVDGERSHPGQVAGILAFDRSFHAMFESDLSAQKTAAILEDPINGTSNPFSVPGARVRYTISAENSGNLSTDTSTVEIIDEIPDGTRLLVSDIAGAGSGPLLFSDGTPTSGLTYAFGGLADAGDNLAFSSNGGASFTYTPSAGGDGTDRNVTHIAFRPGGALSGTEAGPAPNFSISFDLIVE